MKHDYYNEFLQALCEGQCSDPQVAALLAQPAFAVYRNTVFKGCADALAANYPALCRLVGQAWFDAAAHAYIRRHWPQDASLIAYGAGFADFLASAPQAEGLPYLAGVAALERCWSESHLAADAPPLDAEQLLAMLAGGRDVVLLLHPATRWRWVPQHPCYSIWVANRAQPTGDSLAPDWHGEGALLTRPHDQVRWQPASLGACCFLDACAAGHGVAQAAALALQEEPALEIAGMLGELLQAGAFTGLRPLPALH